MSISPSACVRYTRMRQLQLFEDKKRQFSPHKLESFKKNLFNYRGLDKTICFGIENAINQCKV
jgi:hypothetical protein